MAEILDQSAIDALLNEALDIENDEVDADDNVGTKFENRKNGCSFKPVIREKNISAPYVSPVLKSEKILFNPQISEVEEMLNEMPVVRTLKNYNQKNGKSDRKSFLS